MSQNVVFCFPITFPDLTLNLRIYGGCRDFRHISNHFKSDPFGAMRKLVKMTIYRGVNTMVLDG